MLPANSAIVGKTVLEAEFRTRYGLTVVGLRRGQVVFGEGLRSETLKIGDILLVVGFWRDIERLQAERADLVVLNLPAERKEVLPAARRAPEALVCLALVVGLMVSGVVPNVQAALIGCLLMGLLGCIDLNSAYRAIHWPSLVLIVGILPFSIALRKTGGVDLAADASLVSSAVRGRTSCSAASSRSPHCSASSSRTPRPRC
jgi:di/tricarboxylate transporter